MINQRGGAFVVVVKAGVFVVSGKGGNCSANVRPLVVCSYPCGARRMTAILQVCQGESLVHCDWEKTPTQDFWKACQKYCSSTC